jgi:hypothetical protein
MVPGSGQRIPGRAFGDQCGKSGFDRADAQVRPISRSIAPASEALQRSGILDIWSDGRIVPGQIWMDEIESALSRAKAAVLLVNADFLASDFIAQHEPPRLLSPPGQQQSPA